VISLVAVAAFLLAVIVFTTGTTFSMVPDPSYHGDEGGTGSGGGVTTWDRDDEWCTPAHLKKEVHCTIGGLEQCTAVSC
jgi:hypothetical protein